MPLASLPPHEPEETVRGYVQRVATLNGYCSGNRRFAKALFGAAWKRADPLLPTGLASLAAVTSEKGNAVAALERLVRSHTHFNFYASATTSERASRLAERLSLRGFGPVRPVLALSGSEWRCGPARYCAECRELDLSQLGVEIERRHSVTPYVTRCHLHGLPLVDWNERISWKTPDASRSPSTGAAANNSRKFASECFRLLTVEPGSTSPASAHLHHSITSWSSLSKQQQVLCLAALLQRRFSHGFEDPVLTRFVRTDEFARRAASRLLSSCSTVHPVLTALFNILAAEHVRADPGSCERFPLAKRPGGAAPFRVRIGAAVEALTDGNSLTTVAKRHGVSVQALVVAAQAAGSVVQRRPKKVTDEMRESVLSMLRLGHCPRMTAAKHYLSLPTVYRIRASSPHDERLAKEVRHQAARRSHQAAWLQATERHPTLSAKEVRARCGATYAWLYRHDREWLLQRTKVLPQPRRSEGARAPRIEQVSLWQQLSLAADRLRAPMVRPQRISWARLLREAGLSQAINQGRLKPSIASKVACLLDTDHSFVYRRMIWAHEHLRAIGGSLATWSVVRTMSIRTSTIARAKIDVDAEVQKLQADGKSAVAVRAPKG